MAQAAKTAAPPASLLEQRQNATFRAQRLSAVPSDLLTMRNLVVLDLSYNRLTRVPGALLARDVPRLEVLSLQHNLLYVLEDVLALSVAPRLRELNVSANPLRLVENRIYFLEALLNAPGCDAKTLWMVHKDDTLTAQARALPAATATHTATKTRCKKTSSTRPSSRSGPPSLLLVHRLPRRTGFPMLQKLNAQWITDDDVHAVESERGRAIEYFVPTTTTTRGHAMAGDVVSSFIPNDRSVAAASCAALEWADGVAGGFSSSSSSSTAAVAKGKRFDGSRMTAKELLKKTTRSAAIPHAMVIQKFQIDVESHTSVHDQDDHDDGPNQDDGADCDESDLIRRLFTRESMGNSHSGTNKKKETSSSSSSQSEDPTCSQAAAVAATIDDSSWSYPIRTFDQLTSDDRQYIRHRSKQSVESNLQRDDHFFDSSVFLDCVAQAERSRRLTLRAVDTLCPSSPSSSSSSGSLSRGVLASSQSAPSLTHHHPVSTTTAAAQLRQTLASKFSRTLDTKQYDKLETFLHNPPPQLAGAVDDHDMQAALSEYFASEHVAQHQHTRQLLAQHSDAMALSSSSSHSSGNSSNSDPLAMVSSQLDDSLSKTKLRNAVDLANALRLNKKQEKRMMQMLIDADARAIEQERAGLEQALHRHRLDQISRNQFYATAQAAHEADRDWMARAAKHKTPSPWQARNWRAKESERHAIEKQQQRAMEERDAATAVLASSVDADPTAQCSPVALTSTKPPRSSQSKTNKAIAAATRARARPASASASAKASATATASASVAAPARIGSSAAASKTLATTERALKFRTIETVEQASRDSLAHVNSHDLLVRCATIRQSADDHTTSLAHYRDTFLEDEAAWETMRQDPINIVRRHLRRKLYQDAQEVQIAGTQLFYSSLFQ